ncbi:MAG: hypothetical protein ACR2H1_02965, partial [Limisphaerales bacterium]
MNSFFYHGRMNFWAASWFIFLPVLFFGCATETNIRSSKSQAQTQSILPSWPVYKLRSETNWQLNLPNGQRFAASGLFLRKNGELLTVNDRGAAAYTIPFLP